MLKDHPFKLIITSENIDAVKSAYNNIFKTLSPQMLFRIHKMFIKFASMVENSELKEEILGISILKHINSELLESLFLKTKSHNLAKIIYIKGSSKTEVTYNISVEKISTRNGKLYLYCFNHTLNKRCFLNLSGIKSVVSTIFDSDINFGADVCVNFKLNNHLNYSLEKNECIFEEKEDFAIIHGRYHNEFIAKQRMLSFGSDCTVIFPEPLKNDIIDSLKKMVSRYSGE